MWVDDFRNVSLKQMIYRSCNSIGLRKFGHLNVRLLPQCFRETPFILAFWFSNYAGHGRADRKILEGEGEQVQDMTQVRLKPGFPVNTTFPYMSMSITLPSVPLLQLNQFIYQPFVLMIHVR